MNELGLEKLGSGRRLYGMSLRAALSGTQGEDDHQKLREAMKVLRSAMDWLEGEPEFDVAHDFLDRCGALARQKFSSGCMLEYQESGYHQSCPVELAHARVGMSAGFVIKASSCSICSLDPEDCEHVSGRVYDGERCFRLITEAELLEVSLVERPNDPDARIMSVSVLISDLRASLGEGFIERIPVRCDHCLKPCSGLRYPSREAQS